MIDDVKLLELGTRITFSHVLRRALVASGNRIGYRDRKEWKPEVAGWHTGRGANVGVVVGTRTLANGRVEWGDYESPTTFYPDPDRVSAVLVAYDLRRKPVLVLPEHATLVERVTL